MTTNSLSQVVNYSSHSRLAINTVTDRHTVLSIGEVLARVPLLWLVTSRSGFWLAVVTCLSMQSVACPSPEFYSSACSMAWYGSASPVFKLFTVLCGCCSGLAMSFFNLWQDGCWFIIVSSECYTSLIRWVPLSNPPGVGEFKLVFVIYHTRLYLRLHIVVIYCMPVFAKSPSQLITTNCSILSNQLRTERISQLMDHTNAMGCD